MAGFMDIRDEGSGINPAERNRQLGRQLLSEGDVTDYDIIQIARYSENGQSGWRIHYR